MSKNGKVMRQPLYDIDKNARKMNLESLDDTHYLAKQEPKQYTDIEKLKVENHRLKKIIAQQNAQIIQLSQKLENIDLYNEQQRLLTDLGLSSPEELNQIR